MKKQLIRITESDLQNMVMETVNKLIKEGIEDHDFGPIDKKPIEYPDDEDDEFYQDYLQDPDVYKDDYYTDLSDGDLYR
jgi:hypothetical protein